MATMRKYGYILRYKWAINGQLFKQLETIFFCRVPKISHGIIASEFDKV